LISGRKDSKVKGMRITIGGILVVGGVAAAVAWEIFGTGNVLQQSVAGITSLVTSIKEPAVIPVASSVATPSTPISSAVPAVSTSVASVVTAVETAQIVTTPVAVSSVTAAHPLAVVSAPVIAHVTDNKPKPKLKLRPYEYIAKTGEDRPAETVQAKPLPTRKHRRRRRAKAPRPAPIAAKPAVKPAASPAKAADSTDPLIGHYVSMKLKSGREVKGVLQARTAQSVTLEIPGMGPFQYQTSNIDGIGAAQ
jgi:hypothetical protein